VIFLSQNFAILQKKKKIFKREYSVTNSLFDQKKHSSKKERFFWKDLPKIITIAYNMKR
jgi:hypothetical protein